MKWNYRLVKEKGNITVREVYYDEEGRPVTWTDKDGIAACGETPAEVKKDLRYMLKDCFAQPVLVLSPGQARRDGAERATGSPEVTASVHRALTRCV